VTHPSHEARRIALKFFAVNPLVALAVYAVVRMAQVAIGICVRHSRAAGTPG
jgi:hypothetical protein